MILVDFGDKDRKSTCLFLFNLYMRKIFIRDDTHTQM